MTNRDTQFIPQIAEIYDEYLVPLIFEPYAVDLAARVATLGAKRVLEIACGTGAVTRELAKVTTAEIVATDLNPPMIERAKSVGTVRPVEWRQADMLALPFDATSFDAVVCQFGVMFLPDKVKAFSEMRRVVRPGGALACNTWDWLRDNEITEEIGNALTAAGMPEPNAFMERGPHGYYDVATVKADVEAGGWEPVIQTVAKRSVAATAERAAIAFVQGTPMRNQIPAERLAEATAVATRAVTARWGAGPIDAKIQAHVIIAR